MGWQEAARRLWGDDWIAPLAEVAGINRRTVERWKAGDGAPREIIADTIIMLARRSGADAPIAGAVLRRMVQGETEAGIRAEINAIKRSLERLSGMSDHILRMRRGDWPPGVDSAPDG